MSESIFVLKPCPFCGGAAEMIEAPGNAFARQRTIYRVECKKGILCPGMPGTRGYDTEREAAAAWNTRAPQAAAAEEEKEGATFTFDRAHVSPDVIALIEDAEREEAKLLAGEWEPEEEKEVYDGRSDERP